MTLHSPYSTQPYFSAWVAEIKRKNRHIFEPAGSSEGATKETMGITRIGSPANVTTKSFTDEQTYASIKLYTTDDESELLEQGTKQWGWAQGRYRKPSLLSIILDNFNRETHRFSNNLFEQIAQKLNPEPEAK